MDFDKYQELASRTDRTLFVKVDKGDTGKEIKEGLVIPLLGLAGESGSLLSEYKKTLKHIERHELHAPFFREELGDILWYMSSIASHLGISLDDIATANLEKVQERVKSYDSPEDIDAFYDEGFPDSERLPLRFKVKFEQKIEGGIAHAYMSVPDHPDLDDIPLGDKLNDNAHEEDYYRFHDAFHLAFAAVLRWSPAIRALLRRKRKAKPEIDTVEDGARAFILEEAIVAIIFSEAIRFDFYEEEGLTPSFSLIKQVRSLTSNLEVKTQPTTGWEQAILQGCRAFKHLMNNNRGVLEIDLGNRELRIIQ